MLKLAKCSREGVLAEASWECLISLKLLERLVSDNLDIYTYTYSREGVLAEATWECMLSLKLLECLRSLNIYELHIYIIYHIYNIYVYMYTYIYICSRWSYLSVCARWSSLRESSVRQLGYLYIHVHIQQGRCARWSYFESLIVSLKLVESPVSDNFIHTHM